MSLLAKGFRWPGRPRRPRKSEDLNQNQWMIHAPHHLGPSNPMPQGCLGGLTTVMFTVMVCVGCVWSMDDGDVDYGDPAEGTDMVFGAAWSTV